MSKLKLNNVKLGAPQSILIEEAPMLENLDVQITERLESISFKGNTGTKNPFERAADLLRQQEIEMNEKEGIRPYADENHEYWELEYIKTDGKAWIDTGIIPSNHNVLLECTHVTGGNGQILGTAGITFCINKYSDSLAITYYNGGAGRQDYNFTLNSRFTVEFSPNGLKKDGTLVSSTPVYKDSENTLMVFKSSGVWSTAIGTGMLPHQLTVTDLSSNIVVSTLVPAMRRSDRKVGMYDKMRKIFLTDASGVAGAEFGYEFKCDTSISLNIPIETILNGGDTTCEIKSDDTTLPSKDYYWQLTNINPESTGHPTIDQQGNISIEDGKWAEFDVKVKRYADASYIKSACMFAASQKYPELINSIVEYPNLVNSIVDTGMENWITIPNNSTDGYINGITLPYKWNQIGKVEMAIQDLDNSSNWMLFAQWTGTSVGGSWLSHNSQSGFGNVSRTPEISDRSTKNYTTFTFTGPAQLAHIGSWYDGGYSRSMRASYFRIYSTNGEMLMNLVPHKRNNAVGFIDLLHPETFLTNTGKGTFTISTESK